MATETHIIESQAPIPGNGPSTPRTQLKVVMVVGEYPPRIGGVSDYSAMLAGELARLGARVAVVTRGAEGCGEKANEDGVDVRRVVKDWGMREIGRVLAAVDEMGPGAVVSIQYGGYATHRRAMVSLLPAALRLRRPRCRVVVTMHEWRGQRLHWRAWTAPMILAAHGVIAVDPPDAEQIARWTRFNRARITSIPIAPNIPTVSVTAGERRAWRRELGVEDGRPIVAFFGNIYAGKGFGELLGSVRELCAEGVAIQLLVIGGYAPWNGRQSRHEREVLREGREGGWVTMIEKAPAETVSRYLHAADAAVFPFTRGARSNRGSMLTAVAHGLPTITTRGVDTPEGFAEQYGVTLVPAGDAGALVECLKGVLTSDVIRMQMRANALKAARKFSWKDIAGRTAEFYRSVARDGS